MSLEKMYFNICFATFLVVFASAFVENKFFKSLDRILFEGCNYKQSKASIDE